MGKMSVENERCFLQNDFFNYAVQLFNCACSGKWWKKLPLLVYCRWKLSKCGISCIGGEMLGGEAVQVNVEDPGNKFSTE